MSGPVYVYGVVEARRAPSLSGSPQGVPESGAVRSVEVADGLYLVLADADPQQWSEAAIARGLRDMDWVGLRALAHDDVLAALLGEDALVPMKAFTLFSSEKRAIDDVRSRLETVRRVLARVRGAIEWGLRMRFDEQAARERQARAAAETKPTSGAAFLQRKKKLHDAAKNARSDAYAAARRVAERIAAKVKEALVIPAPQGTGPTSLLLEVAFLVPRSATAAIESIVAEERASLAALGVEPELTGPWAPFHFATPPDGAVPEGSGPEGAGSGGSRPGGSRGGA